MFAINIQPETTAIVIAVFMAVALILTIAFRNAIANILEGIANIFAR